MEENSYACWAVKFKFKFKFQKKRALEMWLVIIDIGVHSNVSYHGE